MWVQPTGVLVGADREIGAGQAAILPVTGHGFRNWSGLERER